MPKANRPKPYRHRSAPPGSGWAQREFVRVEQQIPGTVVEYLDAYAIQPYEVGVVDQRFPVGNVLRYGAMGDAILPRVAPTDWVANPNPTDDTVAFQNCVDSLPFGGTMFIPANHAYMLTSRVLLHAGITIMGDGSADRFYGAPPAYNSFPSFVWQSTAGEACFEINGAMSDITISNLVLSPTLTPSTTPFTDGTTGIRIVGTYPAFVWTLVFERLTIYNFHYGISCVDPNSGTAIDWSVCPVWIVDCRFLYPLIGAYLDTNNADVWTWERGGYYVPPDGAAIYLRRAGLVHMIDMTGGGSAVDNNSLVHIEGHGVGSLDNVTMDSCHAEGIDYFVRVVDDGNTSRFNLTIRDSGDELSGQIELGAICHFISINNRFLEDVNVTSPDVRISSMRTYFEAGNNFQFSGGATFRNTVWDFTSNPDGDTTYNHWFVEGGRATVYVAGAPAPVAGDWVVGDRVVNSTPTGGAQKAQACSVSGTPGTWISEGTY